jgi:hypothetical protein
LIWAQDSPQNLDKNLARMASNSTPSGYILPAPAWAHGEREWRRGDRVFVPGVTHAATLLNKQQVIVAPLLPPSPARPPGKGLRRMRCGDCKACRRDDCGKCASCLDRPKFGGEGRRKKACLRRQCKHKRLPGAPPSASPRPPCIITQWICVMDHDGLRRRVDEDGLRPVNPGYRRQGVLEGFLRASGLADSELFHSPSELCRLRPKMPSEFFDSWARKFFGRG